MESPPKGRDCPCPRMLKGSCPDCPYRESSPPGRKRFYCEICAEWIEHEAPNDNVYEGIVAGMDHFRVMHPDTFAEIETWPDGAPVVVDTTLEAQDFDA